MEYPYIQYKTRLSGSSDQPLEKQLVDLEKINRGGYLRVVHHAGEKGFHLKLVLNSEEAISLFVWNRKVFECQNTLARSYGVIPIEKIEVDEEKGDKIIAEGRYTLRNGILEIVIEKVYDKSIIESGRCRYRLKLKGVKEYISPKHGLSARPEYFLIALAK